MDVARVTDDIIATPSPDDLAVLYGTVAQRLKKERKPTKEGSPCTVQYCTNKGYTSWVL